MIDQLIEIINVLNNLILAASIITFVIICIVIYIGHKADNKVNTGHDLPEGSNPCFYCGSHDLKVQKLMGRYNVVCRNCNTDYPGYDTLEEAIKDWNGEEENA